MENQHSNLGLNLPSNPPASGATPFNQFSPYLQPPKPTQVAEPTALEQCWEFLNSKKVIEISIWFILLVLFVPSGIAVASWNAVPGDMTYGWKIGLEKSLLVVLKPSKNLQTSTQVVLTQRRFAEASKMLQAGQAEVGLKNLTDQVHTTSESIQGLAGGSKTEFTMQYIEALTDLNQKLEAEKKLRQGSSYKPQVAQKKTGTVQSPVNYTAPAQGGTTIIQNTYVQNTIVQNVPNIPAQANAPTIPIAPTDAVTNDITQTQQEIQETIAELQTQTDTAPVIPPTEQPINQPDPEPTAVLEPTSAQVQDQEPQVQQPEKRDAENKKSEPEPNSNANEDSSEPNQGLAE